MAGNPNVQQGTLNRLRGSLQFVANSTLNLTASYLGRNGISIAFGNDASQSLGTMTGTVTSGEPYQMTTITAHLVKSQALADTYKQLIQTNTAVGDVQFKNDSSTLSDYQIMNCTILGCDNISANGTDPDWVVRIQGYYQTNSSLFDIA
jgi:hypothetical protein